MERSGAAACVCTKETCWQRLRHRLALGEHPFSINSARADLDQELTEIIAGELGGTWVLVESSGVIEADEETHSSNAGETAVEKVLVWTLSPSIRGIPSLGIPCVANRASELLQSHNHDIEAAVRSVVAGSEATASVLVVDFFLERIPLLGCPTVLLKNAWANLRSIAVVAALYGSDLESPRVQHEILWCLVPQSENTELAHVTEPEAKSPTSSPWQRTVVGETAQQVARALIRGALSRATGLQAAAHCFELASMLCLRGKHEPAVDEDGFVHVTSTPVARARDFFGKQLNAQLSLRYTLPALMVGSLAPHLFSFFRWFPGWVQRLVMLWYWDKWLVLSSGLLLLAALGVGCRAPSGFCSRHRLRRRIWLWIRHWPIFQSLKQFYPQVLTCAVFGTQALCPAMSAYSAVMMMLQPAVNRKSIGNLKTSLTNGAIFPYGWDGLHRASLALLGAYNLSAIASRSLQWATPLHCILDFSLKVTEACCIFVAWMHASIGLDLVLTWFRGVGSEGIVNDTVLGVVGCFASQLGAHAGANPLADERTVVFWLYAISVVSQQALLDFFRRREVLLRLIGAERVMASTLCLLFKGITVARSSASNGSKSIGKFLTRVAPPPWVCVLIVAFRKHAVFVGLGFAFMPILSEVSPVFVGLVVGAHLAAAVLHEWHCNDLGSPASCLAFLIPGEVSACAKAMLEDLSVDARKRAVQLVAMRLLERAMRWVPSPFALLKH